MKPQGVGIDISDRSVELVTIFQRKGAVTLGSAARAELPPGLVERGIITDPDGLAAALARFLDAALGEKRGVVPVAIALPEIAVYSKVFTLPASLAPDLAAKAVALEAADLMPLPLQSAATADTVLDRTDEAQRIFFAAADKETVRSYRTVLERARARALFIDAEALALARALADPRETRPIVIVDIGARTTNFVVVDGSGPAFGSAIMVGGDALSTALERKFSITLAQADVLKRKAGFDPSAADGRAFLVMQRPMAEIIEETRRTIDFHERRTGRKVVKIVLAGGTALMPGIAEYVGTNFPEIEVAVGDPLRGLSLEGGDASPGLRQNAIVYAAAIGLAMRAAGVRAGPGIDLTAEDARRSGIAGALGKARSFIASLTSMTARPKKPKTPKAPKRAPSPPADEPTPAPVPEPPKEETPPPPAAPNDLPDVLRVGAEPAPSPAPAAAPAPEPPAAEAAGEPVPKVWVNEPEHEEKEAEEQDFGSGIGDLLGSADEIKAPKLDAEDLESDGDDSGKLSIETILSQRDGAPPKKPARPAAAAKKAEPRPPSDKPKSRISPLVLLVVLLFLASIGGMYMFVRKNGLPKFPDVLSRFQKGPEAQEPQSQPPSAQAPDAVSVSVVVAAAEQPEGEKPVLLSRVIETDVEGSASFAATGATTVSSGRATGLATIINETDRSYTFVATTRLLTPDGVLFRMKSASPIPANGEVTVEVYADETGPESDIGPSTFSIPGLPSYLQSQIYAKSDASMTGGGGTAKAVTQADIDSAKEKLLADLQKEAEANFSVMMVEGERLHADLVTWQELSAEAPAAGTATDPFTVKMSVRFRALVLPERDILPLLERRLAETAPAEMAADLKLGGVLYTVEAYDEATGRAEVRAEAAVVRAE